MAFLKSKRDLAYLLAIALLCCLCAGLFYHGRYNPAQDISVYYNQEHALNKEIISQIKDADKFVYFAVYTFTRSDIKQALLAAKYRGLTVVGLTDRQQYEGTDLQKDIVDELRQNGIPVYEQDHSGIMHLKVLVTDKAYASGSYNWTSAATNLNDEVLEVGRNPRLRQNYQDILEALFKQYGET
ncbi:MAG TPA: phospholipase D-like domain-containing protein [Patescibacteria group bacterium]|nr:phospholipase D-like domain-containing protein [Patescibacteria group bacterium]